MKVHKEPDKELYKIKVNKKVSNNDYNNSQNYFNIPQDKRHKTFKSNIIPNHLLFSNNNNNQGNIPYISIYNPTTGLKKHKNNCNSVEKYPSIKNIEAEDEMNDNILIRDKKYSKSILNSQNIDENLLNFEPIKINDDNASTRRNIYSNKNSKYDYNKRTNLFIKTNGFNNSNNNDDIIKRNYRTIEHNNINNYINEYQLTNNYYEYEYDVNNKNINFKTYERNVIPFDSERKKNKAFSNISSNNPFLCSSYEKNLNSFSNKNEEFQNNIQEIDNNFNNNFDYVIDNFNIPEVYYMKNNINPEKYNNDNSDKFSNYKIRKSIYNNKDINVNNNINFNSISNSIRERRKYKNISIKSKSKYNDIRCILQNNFTNFNNDKDGYNKKLFNIYRAKLMQEFLRHIIHVINNHLFNYFKFFIYSINFLKINKGGNGGVMPKIYLNKTHRISEAKINNYFEADDNEDKENYKENDIQNSANIKDKKYIQIFYSDKKYPPKPELHKFLTSRNTNELLKLHGKTDNRITNDNEYTIINDQRNLRMMNNTRLFKYIDKFHNINKTISENSTIRNSLKLNANNNDKNNNNLSHNLINSNNNNQILDINNSLNNYIYKKKIKLSKNNTFITRVQKKDPKDTSNKNNISIKNKTYNSSTLSNAKGKKIIDIDINLGKPVKDISDISPLQSFFINDYDNKKFKPSLSVNKNDKTRKKNKNKKKLLLPKKKYLEEGYDFISPIKNEEEDKYKNSEFRTNSYDDKKTKFKNLLTQNNSISANTNNKNYFSTITNNNSKDNNNEIKCFKNILVKNIITSDKRLFIHINYIFSHKSNISRKKYDIKALKIKRNKSLFIQPNKNLIIHKYKSMTNNSFFSTKISKNDADAGKINGKAKKTNHMKNQKDKYLFSCVKFFVKTLNKIFLKKFYAQYKKGIENKNNTIQNMENNKIRTYKRKINKGDNI